MFKQTQKHPQYSLELTGLMICLRKHVQSCHLTVEQCLSLYDNDTKTHIIKHRFFQLSNILSVNPELSIVLYDQLIPPQEQYIPKKHFIRVYTAILKNIPTQHQSQSIESIDLRRRTGNNFTTKCPEFQVSQMHFRKKHQQHRKQQEQKLKLPLINTTSNFYRRPLSSTKKSRHQAEVVMPELISTPRNKKVIQQRRNQQTERIIENRLAITNRGSQLNQIKLKPANSQHILDQFKRSTKTNCFIDKINKYFDQKKEQRLFQSFVILKQISRLKRIKDENSKKQQKQIKEKSFVMNLINKNFNKNKSLNFKEKGRHQKIILDCIDKVMDLAHSQSQFIKIDHLDAINEKSVILNEFSKRVWKKLKTLSINVPITQKYLQEILNKKQIIWLEHLNLRNCKTQHVLDDVAKIEWIKLKELSIKDNHFKDYQIHDLFNNNLRKTLLKLDCSGNQFTNQTIEGLIQANFINLKHLNLGKNHITNQGFSKITKENLPYLSKLYLYENSFTEEGFITFQKKQKFPSLEVLDLSTNKLTNKSLKIILKSKLCKSLQYLNLRENLLNIKTVDEIVKRKWKVLEIIYLQNNFMKQELVKERRLHENILKKIRFGNLSEIKYQLKKEIKISSEKKNIQNYISKEKEIIVKDLSAQQISERQNLIVLQDNIFDKKESLNEPFGEAQIIKNDENEIIQNDENEIIENEETEVIQNVVTQNEVTKKEKTDVVTKEEKTEIIKDEENEMIKNEQIQNAISETTSESSSATESEGEQQNRKITKDIVEINYVTANDEIRFMNVDKKTKLRKQFITDPITTIGRIEQISLQSIPIVIRELSRILDQYYSEKDAKESQKIAERLKAQHQANKGCLATLLLTLRQTYSVSEQLSKLTFQEHSSIRTQATVKVLFSNFLQNLVKGTQILEENQEWKFQEIKEDPKKLDAFIKYFKSYVSQKYHLDKSKIILHTIKKGSIQVDYFAQNSYEFAQNGNPQPLFRYFAISKEDFDDRGNYNFSDGNSEQQIRAGYPYYQPPLGYRYGINVSGHYDNGCDQWLSMDGYNGEWAVGFHAVRIPNYRTMTSIMKGDKRGPMLKEGNGQAYEEDYSVNLSDQKVGSGIYFSPHIQVCIEGYCQQPIHQQEFNYFLVLQCRLNPKRIKICPTEEYWVMNQSQNVRPYGILLISASDCSDYPQVQKTFVYRSYQKQINEYLARQK